MERLQLAPRPYDDGEDGDNSYYRREERDRLELVVHDEETSSFYEEATYQLGDDGGGRRGRSPKDKEEDDPHYDREGGSYRSDGCHDDDGYYNHDAYDDGGGNGGGERSYDFNGSPGGGNSKDYGHREDGDQYMDDPPPSSSLHSRRSSIESDRECPRGGSDDDGYYDEDDDGYGSSEDRGCDGDGSSPGGGYYSNSRGDCEEDYGDDFRDDYRENESYVHDGPRSRGCSRGSHSVSPRGSLQSSQEHYYLEAENESDVDDLPPRRSPRGSPRDRLPGNLWGSPRASPRISPKVYHSEADPSHSLEPPPTRGSRLRCDPSCSLEPPPSPRDGRGRDVTIHGRDPPRSRSRSREGRGREFAVQRDGQDPGRGRELTIVRNSQDPPSAGASFDTGRKREEKKEKKKKQQRDPSVAGSLSARPDKIAPRDHGTLESRDTNCSGAISTMSASAITFRTHCSTTSSMISSQAGGRGRGGKNVRDGEGGEAEGSDDVPVQVSFPNKETALEISNRKNQLEVIRENLGEEDSVMELPFNDKGGKRRNGEGLSVYGHRNSGWSADKTIYGDSGLRPPKPRPPLRKPDAAKSRETMKGRGKSTRSVAGGVSVVSGAGRSSSRDPKGKSERRRTTGQRSLSQSQSKSWSKSRKANANGRVNSRSRDPQWGRDRQGLMRDDDAGGDSLGDRRRSPSRAQTSHDMSLCDKLSRRGRRRSCSGASWRRHRGDASYADSVRFYGSRSSRRPVRRDVDDRGYCAHHPGVRLMRRRSDGVWRVVRKICPECIREDCPSAMGGDRSNRSVDRSVDREVCEERGDRNLGSSLGEESTYSSRSSDDDPGYDNDESLASGADDSLDAFHDLSMAFQTPEEMEEEEATNRLKRRLAARAYHFPGNTWCQDWMQYLSNTHTVLGLFFHHPLHPMGFQERLVILFGSIAIGLTISNFTYLYFIRNGIAVEEEVFTLNSRHTDFTGIPVVSITKLMITLWTLGSFLHTCFDLGLWHMKACTICRYQGRIDDRLVQWGRVVGLFIVMVAIFSGGYAVLLRASIEYKGEGSIADEVEESILSNELYNVEFEDKRSFRFLLGYLVEFVLALFVYYPMAVTVLFSGVLGCGRVPVLGGRPREMKKERRYELSKRQPRILKGVNIEGETTGTMDAYANASYRDDESRSRFDEGQII